MSEPNALTPTSEVPPVTAPGGFFAGLWTLKRELWHLAWAYLAVFLVANALSDDLLVLWRWPLASSWPAGLSPFALYGVMDLFMVKLWLAVFGGALLVLPYVAWRLHRRLKASAAVLAAAILLFYAGVAFTWGLAAPAFWRFLVAYSLDGQGLFVSGAAVQTDLLQASLSQYTWLMLRILGLGGLFFVAPLALVRLFVRGQLDPGLLARKRPYVFLGVALFAAALAPEISIFFFLFLPLYGLFELSLLGIRLFSRQPKG